MKRILFCLAMLVPACGDDDDHEVPALCEQIGEQCHPFDNGSSGIGHDCHELGHDGDLATCEANEAMCLAFCSGTIDGGGPDGAAPDAGP